MTTQPCTYCGLPTKTGDTVDSAVSSTAAAVPNSVADAAPVYCCLGCRIAAGITSHDSESEWTVTRLGMAIFFTMNVMVFTLVLWTWNVHDIEPDSRILAFRGILRYACLLFSTPVLILLGGPLIESSWHACRERRLTTDVLLLLGVAAAFGYSIAALALDSGDVYFEVCCMILVAVTLGKWLEGTAKQKATNAIRSLRDLLPKSVRRLVGDREDLVPIEVANVGDRLRVLPGERVPLDGSVTSASCVVDEQLITGESVPVEKGIGDTIYAGSLNLSHVAEVVVANAANDGTIARLMKAVEEATSIECQSIRLADRLAAWFVPGIFVASLATFAWHFQAGVQQALMASVAVVLIACPCALGIATPMALWVAINSAARRGVLFRSGEAAIGLSKLRSLGLDKTGTLTTGELEVVSILKSDATNLEDVRGIAATLARSSNHPLSVAIAAELSQVTPASDIVAIEDRAGKGVFATILRSREPVFLGKRDWGEEMGFEMPADLDLQLREEQFENAVVCVGWANKIRAAFLLRDSARFDSLKTIEELKKLGLSLKILTGDTTARAAAMQRATGVTAISRLLPEDKVRELALMPSPVGMVGDGLNDALALNASDVGIALDCGADVSRETADVCLLGSTLAQLPWAIRLARSTQQTIRRNLVWAVGYNAVGIAFAMSGNLSPIIAAIAMVGSSLFVLTNSLALGMSFATSTKNYAEESIPFDQQASDLLPTPSG